MALAPSVSAEQDYRIEAGYEFPPETLVVTAEEQHRLHGFCDIPQSRYGERVDPTFLARRPVLLNTASMAACRPRVGKVHTLHRIVQHGPVRLGAPVHMTGRFTAIEDVPRGWLAHSRWDFRDAGGAGVMTVEPQVMMIDPDRPAPPRSARTSAGGAAADGFGPLTCKQCTPETTRGYCAGTRNLIHIDPDHARGFGFRAPIIAGNQTVNFLLEALVLDAPPETFDVTIRFLRPVFWDDAIAVQGRRGGEGGPLQALRAVNVGGKVVADCRVDGVTYGA
jgi:hypothetical protein